MKVVPAGPRSRPSFVLGSLLLVSLASAGAGFWLSHVEVSAFVAERIARARGTITPETTAWLRSIDFRGLALCVTGISSAAAIVCWHLGPKWHAWLARPGRAVATVPDQSSRSAGLMIACSAVAVLLRYSSTLRHGYFRYDDFDLLSVAQHQPWWRAIWIPHGDHFLPFTRLVASASYALFGVTAWPYNLGVLASMVAMVAMGCLLLAELGVSRTAQLIFIALVVLWSPWAEITTGYYILSSYTLIAALGLATVWCYLRWRKRNKTRLIVGAAVCVLSATLLDISGWYVPAALGVFAAADFASGATRPAWRAWWRDHRTFITGVALACAFSLAGAVYAYAVVNRGVFLSMGNGGAHSLTRLAADFVYLFDVGLLVSMFTPFVYARLPVALLALFGLATLSAWLAFLVSAVRAADRQQRNRLGALAAVLAGTCLMVNLGRPSEDTVVVRWAAKHVGPAFLWLCLSLAFSWHVRWARTDAARKIAMAELTLISLGIYWAAQFTFGQLGLAVAFPPFGPAAEIRDAIARRAAVEELNEKIVRPIGRARLGSAIIAPTLDGPYIAIRHPDLFEYNLSTYSPFFGPTTSGIAFVRNEAMHPWRAPDVATVPSLRAAVSPEFLELLNRDQTLREIYFGHVPLCTRTGPAWRANTLPSEFQTDGAPLPLEPDGSATLASDGNYVLWVRREAFDPESTPLLRLALERLDSVSGREMLLTVAFTSGFSTAQGSGSIALAASAGRLTEVDLRQLYAFALSRNVTDVRLILTDPGRYRLHVATLAR